MLSDIYAITTTNREGHKFTFEATWKNNEFRALRDTPRGKGKVMPTVRLPVIAWRFSRRAVLIKEIGD